jgi:hypothetical protein
MKKFLFVCTGNGEFAHLKPLIRKVQKEGHKAIVVVSDNVIPVIRAEEIKDMDFEVFRFNDYDVLGRMTVLSNFYGIDAVVTMPSRGWLINWQRPKSVKVAVTIETNLQFRGVGGSYKLDMVYPEWMDYFLIPWHPEMLERALYSHYKVTSLVGYPDLEKKVKAIGWVPSKKEPNIDRKENYAFSYFGGANTMNEGLLQFLADAYFEVEGTRGLISIGNDIVTGNFPRMELYPAVTDYDSLLANAREVYLHEGYGSIIKCICNTVPVMSFCARTPIKQMEIQPLVDLGLAYKYDKPSNALDINKNDLKEHILKFREQRTEIRKKQKEYEMPGEDNFYNLVMERL